MVPNQITMISNYALVAQLGWRNTFAGDHRAARRCRVRDLPHAQPLRLRCRGEIVEAAEMDSAGPLRLLWRVVLPMSWPTLIAFTLITLRQRVEPVPLATADGGRPERLHRSRSD